MSRISSATVQSCWRCGASFTYRRSNGRTDRRHRYLHFVAENHWVYICDACRNRILTDSRSGRSCVHARLEAEGGGRRPPLRTNQTLVSIGC